METDSIEKKEEQTTQTNVLFDEGGIQILVSKNKMRAIMVIFTPSVGDVATFEEAKNALEVCGIVHGIHWDRVENIFKNKLFDREVVIAEGDPPENGKDAYIIYKHKQKEKDLLERIKSDKTIDHKERSLIMNINKGDVIATKIPKTDGKTGKTVTGEPVPAKPGKDIKIPKGKNTEFTEDSLKLKSAIDGSIFLTEGKITVSEIYKIHGNVDYSTGNIDFMGSVEISGSILSDFKVKAKDYIRVDGAVEAAYLEAGSNIYVNKGISGGEKATIIAGGDIHAKFIENTTIRTKGLVSVEGGIINCNIISGKSITAKGPHSGQGVIAGGNLVARDFIHSDVLGSDIEVPTRLQVGTDPILMEQFEKTKAEYEECNQKLQKLTQAIHILKTRKEKLGSLPDDLLNKLLEAIKLEFKTKTEFIQLEKKYLEMEHDINSITSGTVSADLNIYPGVNIKIKKATYRVDRPTKNTCFFIDNQEIRLRASIRPDDDKDDEKEED